LTEIVSPSKDRSIRSPGPYPGSPHIHSSSRSLRSCFADTPKSAAASSIGMPGRAIRYGTSANSRGSRSCAVFTTPPLHPFGPPPDSQQALVHRLAQYLRLEHDRVVAVARDPAGRRVGVPHLDLDQVAVDALDALLADHGGPPAQPGRAVLGQ